MSNRKLVLKNVDAFIKLRRFENLSLHEACKGLKVRTPSTPRLKDAVNVMRLVDRNFLASMSSVPGFINEDETQDFFVRFPKTDRADA